MPELQPGLVGARVPRVEDPRFLRGTATYVDDIHLSRTVEVAFLRSSMAHADITVEGIDNARAVDGVVDVVTAVEVDALAVGIEANSLAAEWQDSTWPVLAADRVRYVGEAVVAVVADSRYQAEDALEEVTIQYDGRTPIANVAQALVDHAEPIHPGWKRNWFAHRSLDVGDVDGEFAQADRSISRSVSLGRQTGLPMETRACLASYDRSTGQLMVWTATQTPHIIRTGIADHLRLPEHRVRVISPDVGGGFGIKAQLYPEELATCALAIRLGRPVKWIEDRREHMTSAIHARQHEYDIDIAYDQDGTIRALRAQIRVDNGAYSVYPYTAAMEPGMAMGVLTGMYDIRSYRCDAYAVATHKTPFGPYRGVARPSACFAIERVMDEVAADLGMDPVELRRRSLITPEQMPYTTATGLMYDSGDFPGSFDKACEVLDYAGARDLQRRERERGRYLGLGVGCYVEQTAHGTAEFVKRGLPIIFGYDTSRVRMEPSGHVTVYVTSHSHGQGHETTMAQLVAETLTVPLDHVRVVFGDTSDVSYGSGTLGSRSLVMSGGAARTAAVQIVDKLTSFAAHRLEASPDDIELSGGVFSIRGVEGTGVPLSDLARLAHHRPETLPAGMNPTLEVTSNYGADPGTGTFSNAVHLALVEVDPAIGKVTVLRYVVAEDCGRIVNPMIVDGQVTGGVVQGIGGALFEEIVYDDQGQPMSTALMDYLIPTATDVPRIEIGHLETLSPFTVHGIKGMGEGGAIAPGAAIAGAVQDALAPLGSSFADYLPLTPERVLGLIESTTDQTVRPGKASTNGRRTAT